MSRKILNINFLDENSEDFQLFLEGGILATPEYTFLNFSNINFKQKFKDDETYKEVRTSLQYLHDLLPLEVEEKENIEIALKELAEKKREDYYRDYKTVKFDTENIDACLSFIKDNLEFLENKDIVLPGFYNMQEESYLKCLDVRNKIKELLPNAKLELSIQGDILLSTVDDYDKAYRIIENIVNLIKSLNLSPLEQVMFAYDIVKERKFLYEDSFKSRDLISCILGEEIVCVGFDTVFRTILTCLGIKSNTVSLDSTNSNDESGHVRTSIFIEDDKYQVHGHFFCDVTGDSKKEDTLDYKNSYYFFLKTMEDIDVIDRRNGLKMTDLGFLNPSNLYQIFKQLPDNYSLIDFFNICRSTKFNQYLSDLGLERITIEKENNKKEDLIKAYKAIYESFNNPIEPETFVELLYNVKKIEYYLNPEDTPFSIEDLKKSIILNKYSAIAIDRQTKIFITEVLKTDVKTFIEQDKQDLFNSTLTEDREKEINAIKLTRNLRNYLEQMK